MRDLRLLTVLAVKLELVVILRVILFVVGADGLLDDHSSGVTPVLPQSCVVHLPSGPS